MKKVFVISVVLALVSVSCSKECECKTYVNYNVVLTSIEDLNDGDCSDLNKSVVEINGKVMSGYVCE